MWCACACSKTLRLMTCTQQTSDGTLIPLDKDDNPELYYMQVIGLGLLILASVLIPLFMAIAILQSVIAA